MNPEVLTDHLLTSDFLRRIQLLREKLAPLMGRLEFFRSSLRGRLTTPEIDSHRPYAQGDDPRYLDWNLYARLDRFFLKTVVTEEEGLLNLIVDTSASMHNPFAEKMIRSREIAAGIAYLILSSGNQLTIHASSDRLLLSREFLKGEKDTWDLLEQISSLPEGSGTDLGQSLSNLVKISSGMNIRTIIVSDLLEKNRYADQIDLLRTQGGRIGVIHLLHPREVHPGTRGNVLMVDPETGDRKQQLIGYHGLRSHRKKMDRFLSDTEDFFDSRSVPYLRALVQDPFEETVLKFMTLPGWRKRS